MSIQAEVRRERKFVSGARALVEALLLQSSLDERAGVRTAGYVSGYRGSPLGGVDFELSDAAKELGAARVIFQPGLNEDLAATAILGTQQLSAFGEAKVAGVFGLWYGKGPGVDRSGDAFKHGNMAGVSPNGGVVLAFGDDHYAKSSTVAHQSEQAISAHQIPILFPSSVEEVVEFALLGWRLSRFSGLWTALKLVNETAETYGMIEAAAIRERLENIKRPKGDVVAAPHIRHEFGPQRDSLLVDSEKLPLAHIFARDVGLDKLVIRSANPRLCIVSSGVAYAEVREALSLLGLGPAEAAGLGINLYKPGMIWPLEPSNLIAAVDGCDEVLVVEEKRAFVETQVAEILFNQPKRPRLLGKRGEDDAELIAANRSLVAAELASIIAGRLERLGATGPGQISISVVTAKQIAGKLPARTPYFCSGCPHNSSTKVPEGGLALSGIGCHGMAMWMGRNTLPPAQMGAEGANWIGASPFVDRNHVFQNLGDGTYSHSGLLAIRAAVVAGANVTFKILLNDAVAMTGGQAVEGAFDATAIEAQVLAEGVKRCIIVSDQSRPSRPGERHRRDLPSVQRELATVEGVTVLIYEQVCATEKRRRAKRKGAPRSDTRAFINAQICEGCGDCSVQSNCMSILPKETKLGRKREIDQGNCNVDLSCVQGFCPSFVTLRDAVPRRGWVKIDEAAVAGLPTPRTEFAGRYSILIAGTGGTGVVTLGLMIGRAAHAAGYACTVHSMTGLAQKGGSVLTHVQIGRTSDDLHSPKIGTRGADLILACDALVAVSDAALATIDRGRTTVVLNSQISPTADFVRDPDFVLDDAKIVSVLSGVVGSDNLITVDAGKMALSSFGDALAANAVLLGSAFQSALIPLGQHAIEESLKSGSESAARTNMAAFSLGRIRAHSPDQVSVDTGEHRASGSESIDEVIAHRIALLTRYQDDAYAERYGKVVARIIECERRIAPGRTDLSLSVARNAAKLMAYKDEYEVARLMGSGDFKQALSAAFEGKPKLSYHLAPTWLPGARNRKIRLGGWFAVVFRALAAMKWLRGTPFDPFGYLSERRMERSLIADYLADVDYMASNITSSQYDVAVQLASIPETIRGFGHVKEKAIGQALSLRAKLRLQLVEGPQDTGSGAVRAFSEQGEKDEPATAG